MTFESEIENRGKPLNKIAGEPFLASTHSRFFWGRLWDKIRGISEPPEILDRSPRRGKSSPVNPVAPFTKGPEEPILEHHYNPQAPSESAAADAAMNLANRIERDAFVTRVELNEPAERDEGDDSSD